MGCCSARERAARRERRASRESAGGSRGSPGRGISSARCYRRFGVRWRQPPLSLNVPHARTGPAFGTRVKAAASVASSARRTGNCLSSITPLLEFDRLREPGADALAVLERGAELRRFDGAHGGVVDAEAGF